MAMTAEDILEHVRALPAKERLHLVERIVREIAEQTPAPSATAAAGSVRDAIWADVPDDEWDAFTARLRGFREEPWRRAE